MVKKRKTKRIYLPAIRPHRGTLNDGFMGMSMSQFEPSIYGAITGLAAGFVDNMLNLDPKIKGAAMVVGSAFIPAPDSVKGAIAGKGGELLGRSFGIISDTINDGFIVVSEQELNEMADVISDELGDDVIDDVIDDDVINDDVITDAIYEEINDDIINDETQI